MSAAATLAPARGRQDMTGSVRAVTTRAVAHVPPRLLLPPVHEPPHEQVQAAAQLVLPLVRSVQSPVTDRLWPVPTPVIEDVPPPLPDPTRLCGSLVLAAVEALAGTRPLVQLTRWVTPKVMEALTAAASTPGGAPAGRATVRRTHLMRVSPTAAEASVVLHDGRRVRGAALRLEVHRGHWRATVLQIG